MALGVYPTLAEVPLRALVDAGARLALGADDPLLFGPRLAAQYLAARDVHGFADAELAALARASIEASLAPTDVRKRCSRRSTRGSPAGWPRPGGADGAGRLDRGPARA